ncbi:protein ECT2-like [Lycorma delicatula]|uniref:protein ECT2-like n=1 Tax=Lycorma delicatula TaxID=130591 RepID=UPI003F5144BC
MNCFVFYLSIKKKEIAIRTAYLIRQMGGSIRKCYNRNTTHVVTCNTLGNGYEYAITFLIPVMTPEWVEIAWEKRDIVGFRADCEEMMNHRLKPFAGLYIAFVGFPSDEILHFKLLAENKGTLVTADDKRCTHVVTFALHSDINDLNDSLINVCDTVFVVNSEWFWDCVNTKEKVCETFYLYKNNDKQDDVVSKKQVEIVGNEIDVQKQFLFCGEEEKEVNKNNEGFYELNDEEMLQSMKVEDREDLNDKSPLLVPIDDYFISSPQSKTENNEHPRLIEFIETEYRYGKILEVMLQINKIAVDPNLAKGELLNQTEAKIIFNNIEAISYIHNKILDDITTSTNKLDVLSGVFTNYKDELMCLYPAFCNGFGESQKMLQACSQSKPEFRKLLDVWKLKHESGRQHLSELLIRPVQRFGNILIILKDMLHTLPVNSLAQSKIQVALKTVEDILGIMNADKARTEKLCSLFEIYNSIMNCPANLISSNRSLIIKFFGEELTGKMASSGDFLLFFLFSDIIEVCRVRKSVKSLILAGEKENRYSKVADGKPYKHLTTISLAELKRVIDIQDDDDVKNSFALVYRRDCDVRETIYCIRYCELYINNSELSKELLIKNIARCIQYINNSSNFETFLASLLPSEVDMLKSNSSGCKRNLFNTIKSLF